MRRNVNIGSFSDGFRTLRMCLPHRRFGFTQKSRAAANAEKKRHAEKQNPLAGKCVRVEVRKSFSGIAGRGAVLRLGISDR